MREGRHGLAQYWRDEDTKETEVKVQNVTISPYVSLLHVFDLELF
jgi:hypothetical protein